MLTVRFPNGQAVQYNLATYVQYFGESAYLMTKKDGSWIAKIPEGCIVEADPACRVYHGVDDTRLRTLELQIDDLRREVRRLIRKVQK